ncbi:MULTISPECIES: hypothetical protein [Flavobacterium]|uniref:Uncharacterized protein n=1 Tax=Flavobacterium jumunjinense TaxID=998845 RepID=A0ABV5GRG3_9FLAO|nr:MULTISPECIES: hypothetical protein [Flavobacterium]
MKDKRLKYVIVAVQDYRVHGYSNTVHTDKGYGIIVEDYPGGKEAPHNLTNYERITFEKVLREKFGHEAIILEPKSELFLALLTEMELKLKDLLKTQCREFLDHINYRYDEEIEYFGEKYVINGRNYDDKALRYFYEFYEKIKRFYDYNYPLYLVPATQEDEEKYYGDHERGNYYEPISPQK